jgi:hypothetical protein
MPSNGVPVERAAPARAAPARAGPGQAGPRRAYDRAVRRNVLLTLAGAALAAELAVLVRRTGSIGGNVIVRCRSGHLFTTLWVVGGSLKALRLGWWRYQWCPVGRHWSLVTPVQRSELSDEERDRALAVHDLRIP